MKKIVYIVIFATILLFSCSKEQPLTPVSSTKTVEPDMFIQDAKADDDGKKDDDKHVNDITDPEDPDKERTNKKSRKI